AASVAARREGRNLQHRIALAPADEGELGVDEIVGAGQREELRERAGEELGRSVDVPVGEIEQGAALEVVDERPQAAAPALPDLPIRLDDDVRIDAGIEEQQKEIRSARARGVGVPEKLAARVLEAQLDRETPAAP